MRAQRSLVLPALALALALLPGPLAACGGKKKAEKPVEKAIKLPNGLQAELISGACGGPDDAAVAVLFAAGADHDPPGKSGMARIVAQLLSASVGRDHIVLATPRKSGEVIQSLDPIAERMGKFEVTQAALDHAREKVLQELTQMRGGDAARTAAAFAVEAVQPSRGGGWRGGVAAELEAITLADVEAYWKSTLVPANTRVVVVGRFAAKTVEDAVTGKLGPLAPGAPPVLRPPAGSTVIGTLVIGDKPSAVAIAVPAPEQSDPRYPAFLVLAARLTASGAHRTWQASYDPISEPQTLFIAGPVESTEQPEAAAMRIRTELGTALAEPLTAADVTEARARFALLVSDPFDPAVCGKDAPAFAVARARRAQLGIDAAKLGQALAATTQDQLQQAAALFDQKRTPAVIAGGEIH